MAQTEGSAFVLKWALVSLASHIPLETERWQVIPCVCVSEGKGIISCQKKDRVCRQYETMRQGLVCTDRRIDKGKIRITDYKNHVTEC